MQTVDLRRNEFLFLGALLDGRPRTLAEINAWAGWGVCQEHAAKIIRQHSRWGWIQRGHFCQVTKRQRRSIRRRRSAYKITLAGKRVWREEAEWWLYNVSRATKKRKDESLEPKRDFQIDPLKYRPPRSDRLPTAEEAERLLKQAPAAFAVLSRAYWTGVFTLEQLVALRIADVDLAAGTLHVSLKGRRTRIPIAPELRPFLAAAIGDRESGLVFPNQRGREWQCKRVALVFGQLRQAAGLPREIALRGRMGAARKRLAVSSAH